MPKIKYVINFMMLNTIFLLYCMKLSHINHDEKIYTAVFLNFILTSRIKVNEVYNKLPSYLQNRLKCKKIAT